MSKYGLHSSCYRSCAHGQSFLFYSYVQTRLKGQYNGKLPFSLVYVLKLLITAIRAIGLLRGQLSPNGLLANDKLFFLSWNRKLNNNICDTGNEYQAQRNERSFVLKFILAYNSEILTKTNIPMKELPQTNDKNTSMHGFQQEEDQLVIDKWGWVKNKSMWQWAAQKLCSFGCSSYSLYNWLFFSFCYPECI